MLEFVRRYFPVLGLGVLLCALVWAVSFGTLPPADFTFNNGDEVKTVDPPKATGVPEGRIIRAMFEGLLSSLPDKDAEPDDTGNVPMKPQPGSAEKLEISEDGLTYTFTMRKEAVWSNGRRVVASDFAWSWRRMLHPEIGSRYADQLYYVQGAKAYNQATLEVGKQVEVELPGRRNASQVFPQGPMKFGVLKKIVEPPPLDLPEDVTEDDKDKAEAAFKAATVYVVEVKKGESGDAVDWEGSGAEIAFAKEPGEAAANYKGKIERCLHVLPNFATTVAIKAENDDTLVLKLDNRTPYFSELVAFYPLFPVNRECVEEHGAPDWTKPENIVCNGPFRLEFRRIRDRVRMVKNETYWNADNVSLEIVDAMAIKSENTSLNMYLTGQLDWSTLIPHSVIPIVKDREDFKTAPQLATYFYRVNVEREGVSDVRVRRALNMAIDKAAICEKLLKAGQQPARHLVPPGMAGYKSPMTDEYNPQKARELLAEAGYPGGKNFPKVQVLYNTSEGHRTIAEVIQRQWSENLGVNIELRNLEWGSYLDTVNQTDYEIARAGWIGDYPDPNTFLDMFKTGGENNETNWSSKEYDKLLQLAREETDPQKRAEHLAKAERILMDELPILPIYFYVSNNMVKPHVQGFYPNIQDVHPLDLIRIEK